MNVDLKLKTFNYSEFSEFSKLIKKKRETGYTIAFVVPTLNEEKTIGKIVSILENERESGLLDEVFVIDSGSTDKTINEAKKYGAQVFLANEINQTTKSYRGKGENLWQSLSIVKSDIICWVDGDISDFTNRFVYGLIGPLLFDDTVKFVKSMYKRPIIDEKKEVRNGGGRLTELSIKPLIKLYFKELLQFNQPLSGEYGGFKELFLSLDFPTGYGVEIALLIDIYKKYGIDTMCQVDMGKRTHRNRKLQELAKMANEILPVFFNRCKKYDSMNPCYDAIDERISIK